MLFWERRSKKLERALRVALAADGLSDDQRGAILSVLRGSNTAHVVRQPHVLSATELQVIEQYRRLDANARRGIQVLFSHIPEPTQDREAPADEDQGHDAQPQ